MNKRLIYTIIFIVILLVVGKFVQYATPHMTNKEKQTSTQPTKQQTTTSSNQTTQTRQPYHRFQQR